MKKALAFALVFLLVLGLAQPVLGDTLEPEATAALETPEPQAGETATESPVYLIFLLALLALSMWMRVRGGAGGG